VLFQGGTIAQVVVHRHAGVVDEDVEGLDGVDRCADLPRAAARRLLAG
jgi:hypothetical protein